MADYQASSNYAGYNPAASRSTTAEERRKTAAAKRKAEQRRKRRQREAEKKRKAEREKRAAANSLSSRPAPSGGNAGNGQRFTRPAVEDVKGGMDPMKALAKAKRYIGKPLWDRMCQAFVVNMYGSGGGAPSAAAAWRAADAAGHGHKTDKPPVGAAVYWTGGNGHNYGHTAIVSRYVKGQPYVITTGINGKIGEVPMSYFGGKLKYQGWVSKINARVVNVKKFRDDPDDTKASKASGGGTSGGSSSGGDGAAPGVEEKKMSKGELASAYGYGLEFFNAVPELERLFGKAFKQGWTGDRFAAEFKSTEWFQKHSASFRETFVLQKLDPKTYKERRDALRDAFARQAVQMGATLGTRQAQALAAKAMTEGWSDDSGRIAQELAEWIDTGRDLTGTAGDTEDVLRELATRNGVGRDMDDRFFRESAAGVVGGQVTSEVLEDQIRARAAKKWAAWSDQILAGKDVADLASSHVSSVASMLEVDPDTVDLDDPLLARALRGTDDKGNPAVASVTDLERMIRQDSRWRTTKNARDEMTSVGFDVLRRFGMVGVG